MKHLFLIPVIFLVFTSCQQEEAIPELRLQEIKVGEVDIPLDGSIPGGIPTDRPISIGFSHPLDPQTIPSSFSLSSEGRTLDISTHLIANNRTLTISTVGGLEDGKIHQLDISQSLRSEGGAAFAGQKVQFKTQLGDLQLTGLEIPGSEVLRSNRIQNAPVDFQAVLHFGSPISQDKLEEATKITGPGSPVLGFTYADNGQKVTIRSSVPLQYLSRYTLTIGEGTHGASGENFPGKTQEFYTQINETPKFPLISDDELLTKVQEYTFRYFWDFAHPVSGLARERNTSGNTVTSGGSGFGLMAIIVGVERGFITRGQAVARWGKVVDFLARADRFHGAWSHWINGETGKAIPFSTNDNGGDLVETALLVQGLLTVKSYLQTSDPTEKALADKITQLWEGVEWDWYTREDSGKLYWHWSPDFGWVVNLPIQGYNEALITYILAAASPSYPIDKETYVSGWAKNGDILNGNSFYGYQLPLGYDYGGPLFFAHYSFLGLDPRKLSDTYANYWEQNVQHSLINQAHSIENPLGFVGYSDACWGLTASDNQLGYNAHSPSNDKGVITPTAALSSFPYTPTESMKALKYFYYQLGDRIWGEYGFYDAFNLTESWYADSYLAIDQGPIIIMLENHRTGLLWELFMENPEVKSGLDKLGFSY